MKKPVVGLLLNSKLLTSLALYEIEQCEDLDWIELDLQDGRITPIGGGDDPDVYLIGIEGENNVTDSINILLNHPDSAVVRLQSQANRAELYTLKLHRTAAHDDPGMSELVELIRSAIKQRLSNRSNPIIEERC
ncbi:MAG: hypothetical protein AAF465_09955 [Pseudomonadota bacterium]